MSKEIFLVLLGLTVLSGCFSRRYDITLNNGSRITGVSKPKLDGNGNRYYFKDASGREESVPAMRVGVIEPHQESKSGTKR